MNRKTQAPASRSPYAAALRLGHYRGRVVRSAKVYTRKGVAK